MLYIYFTRIDPLSDARSVGGKQAYPNVKNLG